MKILSCIFIIIITTLFLFITSLASALRVAVIGDYGRAVWPAGPPNDEYVDPAQYGGKNITGEQRVANAINESGVNFDIICTLGDNNYLLGYWDTIDENVGQFYRGWIYPYVGNYSTDPATSKALRDKRNYFFPILGNHDGYNYNYGTNYTYVTQGAPYLKYFADVLPQQPAKGRYYDFVQDNVHFIMLNSNLWEPDGRTMNSTQAQWTRQTLQSSRSTFKLVLMHHTPYSNCEEDLADPQLRWPFALWGATAVLSGHCHAYQKFNINGFYYFVNGLGGTVPIAAALPKSKWMIDGQTLVFYNDTWGYQQISTNGCSMNISFVSIDGRFFDVTSFYANGLPECRNWNPNNNNNNDNNTNPSSNQNDGSDNEMGTGIAIGVACAVGAFLLGYVVMSYVSSKRRSAQDNQQAYHSIGNNN